MQDVFCALLLVLGTALTPAQGDRDREEALRHLRAGQEAMEVERWDEAEREFQAAIKLDPLLELAHYGLGRVYMATKRYPKAIDAFISCRNVFQGNVAEGQAQRLDIERKVDDQLLTLRDYRRALESGRVRSRDVAGSLRRVDDDIRQLERLRQRSHGGTPSVPPYILIALGSAYFRFGAFPEAEREWRQAIDIDPAIGEVHNNLAVVLMLTERYDEAEREILLAEKLGFRVNQGLKDDLKARRAKKTGHWTWNRDATGQSAEPTRESVGSRPRHRMMAPRIFDAPIAPNAIVQLMTDWPPRRSSNAPTATAPADAAANPAME
jgi:tetratricopeptide (TPR) repeat protein